MHSWRYPDRTEQRLSYHGTFHWIDGGLPTSEPGLRCFFARLDSQPWLRDSGLLLRVAILVFSGPWCSHCCSRFHWHVCLLPAAPVITLCTSDHAIRVATRGHTNKKHDATCLRKLRHHLQRTCSRCPPLQYASRPRDGHGQS